jgi:hypothetical protein
MTEIACEQETLIPDIFIFRPLPVLCECCCEPLGPFGQCIGQEACSLGSNIQIRAQLYVVIPFRRKLAASQHLQINVMLRSVCIPDMGASIR